MPGASSPDFFLEKTQEVCKSEISGKIQEAFDSGYLKLLSKFPAQNHLLVFQARTEDAEGEPVEAKKGAWK